MLRPSRRDHAAADDDGGLAVKLEKNRQMTHGSRNAKRIARRKGRVAERAKGDIGFTGPRSRRFSFESKGKPKIRI